MIDVRYDGRLFELIPVPLLLSWSCFSTRDIPMLTRQTSPPGHAALGGLLP